VALAALMVVGVVVLAWLSSTHDRVTGKPPVKREPAPWLRSMRSTREEPARRRRETNAVEAIVVMSVVVAFIAFEIWFFLLASGSVPNT
jgi:cobalamin biosynthesis protein CobD/CbiB